MGHSRWGQKEWDTTLVAKHRKHADIVNLLQRTQNTPLKQIILVHLPFSLMRGNRYLQFLISNFFLFSLIFILWYFYIYLVMYFKLFIKTFILHVFFSQAWLLFTQFYIPDFPPYYYLCDIFTPAFFSITSYIPYVMNPLFFRRTSVPFAQWHCYTIYSHRVTSQVFWIMSFKGILLGQWVIITFSILLDNGRLFSKGTIPSL